MSLQPIDFQQPPLSILLHDAKFKHESATKKLWNYLFSKLIFFELKFVIGPEQPPVEYESQKRIDITIEVPSDNGEFFVVGICEKKKGKASPQDTVTVEDQAKKRSHEHCHHSRRTSIWAITVIGPKIRIWIYDFHGDQLQGILPSGAPRKRDSYLDISDSDQQPQILQMFEYIKRNLNPPLADVARAYATGQDYQHGQGASYQYDQTASYGQGASSSVDTGYDQGASYQYDQTASYGQGASSSVDTGYDQGASYQYDQTASYGQGASSSVDTGYDQGADQTASYGQGAGPSVDTGYGQSQGATGTVMESGNQAEAAQPTDPIEVRIVRHSKKHVYAYRRGDKKKTEIQLPSEGWLKDNRKDQAKQWYWMMGIEGKDYYTADKLR